MPAPPGTTLDASAHLSVRGEGPDLRERVSTLLKEARTYRQLDSIGNRRLAALVNAYVNESIPQDFFTYCVSYSDPTG